MIALVLSTHDHSVLALVSKESTVLLDLPSHRTHLVLFLLSRFSSLKVQFTKNLLLKERFTLSRIEELLQRVRDDEEGKTPATPMDDNESFFPGGDDGTGFSTESFFEDLYKNNVG